MKATYAKLTTLLLALLMVLSVFAACGKTPDDETGATTAAAASDSPAATETVTEILPDLEDIVWNREFRILGCADDRDNSFPSFELTADSTTGDYMNDAVYSRNEKIFEKYGITVTQTLETNMKSRIEKDYNSTEDNFDLVFTYVNQVGGLAQQGYFLDMNEIDNIGLSKPWWNKNVNDSLTVKGKLFYASSDFSLRDKNRVSVMLVNDDLRKDLKLDPVPDQVTDHSWTADKMLQYVTVASTDLNGDGQHTSDDQYGLVMHSYNAFASICFGLGVRLIDKDAEDGLIVVANPDHDSSAVDMALKLCGSEVSMTPEKYNRDWAISANTLRAGRALFASTLLSSVGNFNKDCTFDFTVCPNPMLNESQEKYYTIPDVYCMFFAVPVQSKTPEFTGFALEALSYASTDTTLTTFIDLLCKQRNVRNVDSVAMINVIFDGIVYDNAICYSSSIKLYGILNSTIPDGETNVFNRMLTSLKGATEIELGKINDAYEG